MSQFHLFIDTNIFLNYYHHTDDDINVIDLLINGINKNKIILHLPQQVRDEFERNREVKLSTSANEFNKISFTTAIPRHMQSLDSASVYSTAVEQAKRARDRLVAEATLQARTHNLETDVKLYALFDVATNHSHDQAIVELAKQRATLGNPPGKPGSTGDQYNWEILLSKVPTEDLYILTKDGDYISALGGSDENGVLHANAFLKKEWSARKDGRSIYIFKSIKSALSYFAKLVPDDTQDAQLPALNEPAQVVEIPVIAAEPIQAIEAPIDMPAPTAEQLAAKNAAIESLTNSHNFAATHSAIANLNLYSEFFTPADAHDLFSAAFDNQQIKWIVPDDDVNTFYVSLLSRFFNQLEPHILDEAIELLGLQPDDEDLA